MSKEYTEREAVIKAIENDCLELVYYTKEDAIQCVKAIPAADVVEVVRCENCVHYHPCQVELTDGSAPDWGICDQPWFNDDKDDVDAMFYCAQGERREDKTDECCDVHCAHWIKENDLCYDPDAYCLYAEYSCSYCGVWVNDRSGLPEYCPECGRKMKRKQ